MNHKFGTGKSIIWGNAHKENHFVSWWKSLFHNLDLFYFSHPSRYPNVCKFSILRILMEHHIRKLGSLTVELNKSLSKYINRRIHFWGALEVEWRANSSSYKRTHCFEHWRNSKKKKSKSFWHPRINIYIVAIKRNEEHNTANRLPRNHYRLLRMCFNSFRNFMRILHSSPKFIEIIVIYCY